MIETRIFLIALGVLLATKACNGALAQGAPQGFAGLGTGSPDYAQVSPQTQLRFPDDHASHPGYRIEWWYVTANLTAEDGTPMGLQWTLFRNALVPDRMRANTLQTDQAGEVTPERVQKKCDRFSDSNAQSDREPDCVFDLPKSIGSADWTEQTVWMGHAGVTTPERHLSAERFARGGIGQSGVTLDDGFSAWIDDWSLSNADAPSFKSLRARAKDTAFSYDVMLTTDRDPVLQGDKGYSVKSESGQASHYYSQPFYNVSGTITISGNPVAVTGKAWLDREWSSQFLNETQTGWDWFSLHLDDGAKVMLFRLRDRNGVPFYSGNLISTDGTTQQLSRTGITITPIQQTRIDGRKVPTGWRVEIPEIALDVRTLAINRRAMMDTLFSYWEGPIRFSGTHSGVGYLEMTGY